MVHITIALSGIDKLADSDFIYMYGTY